MKLKVSSAALFSRLTSINRVLNSKNSFPILDCFLFETEGTRLTITASDSETTLVTKMELAESDMDARFCIKAKTIQDSLKEIADQPVTLNINFAGNIEGRDVAETECDVVITDGFSGNIFLKSRR